MNYLLKKPDGSIAYPYSLAQLRTDNPTTSFPESLEPIASDWNCFPVKTTQQPQYNPITHTLTEGEPLLVDGEYQQTWVLINYSLEQIKSNKLGQIDQDWYGLEAIGWDSGQGFSLGIAPSDVALIVGVYSLAKEAAALGLELPNLISMNNTPISFNSIEEMTTLLLQYGQARSNMATSFAARRKAVEDATTIEEVGVI